MPTVKDNIIGEDREVLVASLMSNFLLNFGEIITYKMKIWETKWNTAYPFSCFVMTLYEAAHMPQITALD